MFSAITGKAPTDDNRHPLYCTSYRRRIDQVVRSLKQEELACPRRDRRPAQLAPSEFELDEIIENIFFEGESEVKTEGGGIKSKTGRRRAFSMPAFTERWQTCNRQPMRNAYMMQEGGTTVSATSSILCSCCC